MVVSLVFSSRILIVRQCPCAVGTGSNGRSKWQKVVTEISQTLQEVMWSWSWHHWKPPVLNFLLRMLSPTSPMGSSCFGENVLLKPSVMEMSHGYVLPRHSAGCSLSLPTWPHTVHPRWLNTSEAAKRRVDNQICIARSTRLRSTWIVLLKIGTENGICHTVPSYSSFVAKLQFIIWFA